MIRSQALQLPVGDVPDWEVDGSDNELDLKSPAESCVIFQSLKQSRDKWLREMFPKFSSRGRGGKQPDVVPPPHTIYNRGRCTLQIGPHFFTDTTVFEVHYRAAPVAVSQPSTFVYQPVTTNSFSQVTHQTQAPSPQAPAHSGDANTLLSSFSSSLSVPPGLVTQVNAAATSNPALSNLLQLTASGRVTADQLKTLGLIIQSLSSTQVASAANVPTTTPQPAQVGTNPSSTGTPLPAVPVVNQYLPTVKDFDIVIEFRESPSDRWIFPRGPATCDFVSTSGDAQSIGNLTVSTIVPFSTMIPPQDVTEPESSASTESIVKQVVEFHFKMASSYIWDTFSRWVGPKEKMEEYRKILMEIEPPEQKFLAYRLPEGSQLTQIQNAAMPSYAMKLIKPPTEGGRSKRKAMTRKSTQDLPGSPTAKRKRQAQPKTQAPLPRIACFACSQTNVPLMMGGRYCRPCVEGGRAGETSGAAEVTSAPTRVSNDVHPPPKSVDHLPQSPKSQSERMS